MTMTTKTLGDLVQGRKPLTVEAGETVADAVRRMVRADKGAVLVVKHGRLEGIFTERDLLRRVVALGLDVSTVPVGEVMTSNLVVARPDESYQEGLRKMVAANFRHLPVVEGDRVVGVVSRRELMSLDLRVCETLLERCEPSTLFI